MDFRRQMNDLCAYIFDRMTIRHLGEAQRHETQYSNGAVYVRSVFGDDTRWNCADVPAAQADNSHGVAGAGTGRLSGKVSVSGRKEKPLRLTESGKRYTADKLGGLYRAEERAAAAMGAEQFAMMVEMTRKFTDSFEKEIRNGAE